MAVHLKGEFDNLLKNASTNCNKFFNELNRERSRPRVWSAEQVEDLFLVFNALRDTLQAISIMANEIRDD